MCVSMCYNMRLVEEDGVLSFSATFLRKYMHHKH